MASRGKVLTQAELLQAITQAIEDLFKKSAHHLKFVDVNGYVGRCHFCCFLFFRLLDFRTVFISSSILLPFSPLKLGVDTGLEADEEAFVSVYFSDFLIAFVARYVFKLVKDPTGVRKHMVNIRQTV